MMFRRLPQQGGTARETAEIVNRILDGKINSTGTVTVNHLSVPVTVTDPRVGADSVILLMPTNSDGAQLMAHIYFSSVTNGEFVISLATGHGSLVGDFRYVILG